MKSYWKSIALILVGDKWTQNRNVETSSIALIRLEESFDARVFLRWYNTSDCWLYVNSKIYITIDTVYWVISNWNI